MVTPSFHIRSISLPTKAHPQTENLEEQLCRLRSSSTASTLSSSICQNLGLLNDLYESFDDFIQLPHVQKALSQCHQVEKSLDGSVKLLDICSMSKDALVIMKESLQKLESSLRRKSGESAHSDVHVSRKNMKRIVKSCFKSINKMDTCNIKEIQGKNPEQVALLSIMSEIEEHSLTVLRSILSFVFGAEEKSFLSKFISSKQTGNQGEVMEKMDRALEALKGQKTEKLDFHAVESIIQELGEALECLFRKLLKTRVSLLNMITIS